MHGEIILNIILRTIPDWLQDQCTYCKYNTHFNNPAGTNKILQEFNLEETA